MGLLDDLRQQSDDLKEKENLEKNRKERAEQYYLEQINPKMKMLYQHLAELTKHLNYIKPDVKSSYVYNGEGLELELVQHTYGAKVDSVEMTKQISLTMVCEYPKEITFMTRDPALVENNVRYMNKYNIQHQVRRSKDDMFNVTGAHFTIPPTVNINFLFRADIEKGCISLKMDNFNGFGTHLHDIKPEKITEEYLDQIGRFIIRQNTTLFSETIDDEAKERIRAQILAEQKSREIEMEEADKAQAEELAIKREQSMKSQLMKKIKNINVPQIPFPNLKKQRNA